MDGNSEDQASADELKNYIQQGYVTDLGPNHKSEISEGASDPKNKSGIFGGVGGKEKEIKHMKWVDGKEVLDYVEKLQELSVDGITEFQHAAGGVNVFREDKIDSCSQESREQIRENFSAREGDLLKVQAVFENRTL